MQETRTPILQPRFDHRHRRFIKGRPAAFHLRVYYLNGASRSYWSRDFLDNNTRDDEGGFEALVAMILEAQQYIQKALIYDKRNGRDDLVRKCGNPAQGWEVCETLYFPTVNA